MNVWARLVRGWDLSGSLARQAALVALVAMLIDIAMFTATGVFTGAPWRGSVILLGLVAADLALAGPTEAAGVVAVAHVVLRLVAAWLLAPWLVHRGVGGLQFDDVGVMVAGFRAGAWTTGARSIGVVVILTGGTVAFHLLAHERLSANPLLLVSASLAYGIVPWLVGRYTTERRGHIAALELRLQRQRAAVEHAITAEREAIARDLHDVISHHVSAMGIHAGAARLALTGTENITVATSLAAVESGGRAAMADLRRQLDLLHGANGDGPRQPGLADIDGLLDRARAAGLTITYDVVGSPIALPESVDVALHRIVQEVLTNALRHGGGEQATLRIEYTTTDVRLHASNPLGAAAPATGSQAGHGLAGIRQRAELFGGMMSCGPEPDRKLWAISVCVPIGERRGVSGR